MKQVYESKKERLRMAKVTKDEQARLSGAEWMLRLVKENGIEAAEEELKMRGGTGWPLRVKKKDLEDFEQGCKENAVATITTLASITLRDEFGFGKERIKRLEQYPKGLGPTDERIAQHLTDQQPIEKITFSAYDTEQFVQALEQTGRKKILIAGIETHICVYQTAAHLLANGYEVEVLVDCVSSRTAGNREVGIQKMIQLGANIPQDIIIDH